MYDQGVLNGNYVPLFKALEQEESLQDEFVWRRCRAERLYAINNLPKQEYQNRKLILDHAFGLSQICVDQQPNNFHCHKWHAILLSDLSELSGTKAQLLASPKMKEHFEKALELNYNDANVHHSLGAWHFSFADLGWMQRKIASTVFAKVPESDHLTALKYFKQAEEIQPGFYTPNWLYLCKCYRALFRKTTNENADLKQEYYDGFHFWKNKMLSHVPRDNEEKAALEAVNHLNL